MKPANNRLHEWMRAATVAQQNDLAERVGSTKAYMYQLSGNFRRASADFAAKLEEVTRMMAEEDKGLPVVYRTDVCESCGSCRYAQQVLGGLAARGDFEKGE